MPGGGGGVAPRGVPLSRSISDHVRPEHAVSSSLISPPPCLLRLLPAGANRRVGLAPTGKRRLVTAHTLNGPSARELLKRDALAGEDKAIRTFGPFGKMRSADRRVQRHAAHYGQPS